MVQFLTSIPIPVRIDAKEEDFGKGLVFAPAVGLIIGGVLTGAYLLVSRLHPEHHYCHNWKLKIATLPSA